jgi:hypothetical protein
LNTDRGLYSNEIEANLKNIKSFKGVVSQDRLELLKAPMKKDFSCIINLEDSNEDGSHWVALYNDKNENFTEYFDSYGMKPALQTIRFVKKHFRKSIYYNDTQVQGDNSKRCGFFCQFYIKSRSSGKSPYDTLYSLKQEPSKFNEEKVLE